MERSLLEMAMELVLSQSEQRIMNGEELDKLLKQTYRSLREIQSIETGGGELTDIEASIEPHIQQPAERSYEVQTVAARPLAPMMEPSESIKEEAIVCLECGKEFKQLSHTHLTIHGLSPNEYRQKYGLRKNQPLASKSSTDKRKSRAQEQGTGQRLKEAREAKQAKQ